MALGDGLAVADNNLDEVYLGWSGHCRIEWPERHAGMAIECAWPRPNLVVYSPLDAPFVCVEAVTNQPDAFNFAPEPSPGQYDALEPGAAVAFEVTYRPYLQGRE